MALTKTLTKEEQILKALFEVKDPEIPVISVVDLGIIPKVSVNEDGYAVITMTPTFTACPATQVMQNEIIAAVEALEFVEKAIVKVDFSIPWTSDKISELGRQQLKEFEPWWVKNHCLDVFVCRDVFENVISHCYL